LAVPLESEQTYDVILGAVAALDQRRHRVAELFTRNPRRWA
jgi:hypothetical protein